MGNVGLEMNDIEKYMITFALQKAKTFTERYPCHKIILVLLNATVATFP